MIRRMCVCKFAALPMGNCDSEKAIPSTLRYCRSMRTCLINRGRYLALFGQHERAIAAFEQALALNPDLALARQGLAESAAKARRP